MQQIIPDDERCLYDSIFHIKRTLRNHEEKLDVMLGELLVGNDVPETMYGTFKQVVTEHLRVIERYSSLVALVTESHKDNFYSELALNAETNNNIVRFTNTHSL